MAEPDLGAPADLVRRYDPDLFSTALFAAEPGRSRLMALYAADVELSRAVHAARTPQTGPLIAAMRLQWWRDVADAATEGRPAPEHETAGPFAQLIADGGLTADGIAPLLDAYEAEIAERLPPEAYPYWAEGRFGTLIRLASRILAPDHPLPDSVAKGAGLACATAFAFRTAPAMARDGRSVLPALAHGSLGDLQIDAHLAQDLADQARTARAALSDARRAGRDLPRSLLPALLPARLAESVLRKVELNPQALMDDLSQGPAGRAATLLRASIFGRW